MKNNIVKYGITLAVGLVFAFLICVLKDIFVQTETKKIIHILVDAFFAPGAIILCFGLLVVASNGGMFHIISYGMMSFVNLFRKKRTQMKYKTYYDYKKAMSENPKPFLYMVIVGLFYVAVSMVFLILWYQC